MIELLIAVLLAQQPAPQAPPSASPSAPLSEGQLMWDFRCKSCHEPAQAGIPDRAVIAKMRPNVIVRSLERGNMKAMGSTMTPTEKRLLANFITGKA